MPKPTTSRRLRHRAGGRGGLTARPQGQRTRDRALHGFAGRCAIAARGYLADEPAAAALLGDDHRLVRTLDVLAVLRRQLVVASVALAAGALGIAAGAYWAPVVLAAAAVVELALVSALVVLSSLARALAREAIIDGDGELPLRLVARERRRLANPRRQAGLARALESLVRAAATWPRIHPAARPVFDVRQIRAAAPELEALAQLLRARPASPRAVALLERLLTSGNSPLYGRQPDELHRELELIRQELVHDPAG